MVQTSTTDCNRMVLYWRNSLVDGYRIQELEYEIEVDKEAVQTGNIGPEKVAQIKDRYKEAMRTVRERGKEAEIPKEGLPVLVCPIKLSKKYNHYQESTAGGQKELIPLWIPALVNNDGQLHQRENYLPWIARDLLEPTTKKGVTIGDIEDVEKYLATHGQDMWENWQSLWTYADAMLRAMPEGELSLPGYVATGQCYIMPDVEVRGAAMNAIQVMDYVIETKLQLPLLTCYAGLQEAPEKPILDQEGHMAAAFKHNGQMSGDFPLSPSQREALHHFLILSDGEILAVNGPPGTGKTTLMHSVIAAVWVNAALNQSEPPVIVTVSSNNQAVTNMIDSFQKGSVKDESILIERWIPGIESYGLYCPSGAASKKEENSKYQKASPGDNNFPAQNGFPALVEDASFIDRAEKYYLEHYKEFTGKTIASVRDAVAVLHQDLKFMSEKIHAELNKQQEYIKASAIAEDTLKKVRIKYGISSIEDIINKLNHIHTQYDAEKIQLKYELSDITSVA